MFCIKKLAAQRPILEMKDKSNHAQASSYTCSPIDGLSSCIAAIHMPE
ncbi:MAG: hypothetical protein ACE3JN_01840 [Ectobacillus sp.]